MKIVDVRAFPLSVPIKKGLIPIPVRTKTIVVVKVFTDEGITGIGEPYSAFRTAPAIVALVEHALKPIIVGQNPLRVKDIWNLMYRGTFYYGRKGLALCAMSGIEQALWDIAGKANKTPVYQMLGGASQERIRAYGSLHMYQDMDDFARVLTDCLGNGYTAIKLHQRDIESVEVARKVVGDEVILMVDVNAAWTHQEAIRMANAFQEHEIFWLEEPLWPGDDYEGLSALREAVEVPIAIGENEYTLEGFTEIAMKGAADFFQPSVAKMGIGQTKEVLSLAHDWDLSISPHCFYLGPSLIATLHVAISDKKISLMETPVAPLEEELFVEPFKLINGHWEIRDNPGLGIEMDEEILSKYPYKGEDGIAPWCRWPSKTAR